MRKIAYSCFTVMVLAVFSAVMVGVQQNRAPTPEDSSTAASTETSTSTATATTVTPTTEVGTIITVEEPELTRRARTPPAKDAVIEGHPYPIGGEKFFPLDKEHMEKLFLKKNEWSPWFHLSDIFSWRVYLHEEGSRGVIQFQDGEEVPLEWGRLHVLRDWRVPVFKYKITCSSGATVKTTVRQFRETVKP